MQKLESYIRSIPDFPKPGIVFRDIAPLLNNPEAFNAALDAMVALIGETKIEKVVGTEARGFIFGSVLAHKLNAGFVPVRKYGKLPYKTISEKYNLEYGEDHLEIHVDAIKKGEKVLLHDDVLATGGTAATTCSLIEKLGGEIAQCLFLMEIEALNGKEKLKPRRVSSLLQF